MKKTKKERILEMLNESEIELFPWQIVRMSGFNGSTVRNYLRDLLREGKIVQPYLGSYCSKIMYGMIAAPVRVHNVILSVDAPFLGDMLKIPDWVEWEDDVKVWLQFGSQRRKVTIRLACDAGMDKRTFSFALHRAYQIFEMQTRHAVENVTLRSLETNRDFHGVRLDSVVKCFTRKAFEEFLDRIYQKSGDLRVETKISRDMEVDEILELIHGGVPSFELTEIVLDLRREVKALVQAVKMLVETQNRIIKQQNAIRESFIRAREDDKFYV